ncbi:hypothetical protein HRbin36_02578 [bacterium HR36]|nr:hypothetical protein HRbin36_02578 [bacterium HR36]
MTLLAFRCGACGRVIAVAESYRGHEVCCGGCGQNVRVPQDALSVQLPTVSEIAAGSAPDVERVEEAAAGFFPATPELTMPVAAEAVSATGQPQQDGSVDGERLTQTAGPPTAATHLEQAIEAEGEAGITQDAQQVSPAAEPSALAGTNEESPWQTVGPESVAVVERRVRPPAAVSRRRIPISFWLLAVLVPTTVTFVAISVILFRLWMAEVAKKERHPLEDLPDTVEAITDVGGRPLVVNPVQTPPEGAVVRLGETKRYDGIEVTPVRVCWQQVTYARTQDGRMSVRHPDQMLALYLRIRNVSDHIFQPFEPIYNAAYRADRAVYTYLTVGEERYYGPLQDVALERIEGQVIQELWPMPAEKSEAATKRANGMGVNPQNGTDTRAALEQQEGRASAQRAPELETLVLAYQSPSKRKVSDALQGLPAETVLRWHVQLRKGRQDRVLRGKGARLVWLTTVVPVEFTVGQIEKGAP